MTVVNALFLRLNKRLILKNYFFVIAERVLVFFIAVFIGDFADTENSFFAVDSVFYFYFGNVFLYFAFYDVFSFGLPASEFKLVFGFNFPVFGFRLKFYRSLFQEHVV